MRTPWLKKVSRRQRWDMRCFEIVKARGWQSLNTLSSRMYRAAKYSLISENCHQNAVLRILLQSSKQMADIEIAILLLVHACIITVSLAATRFKRVL